MCDACTFSGAIRVTDKLAAGWHPFCIVSEDAGGAPADDNSETVDVDLVSTQLLCQILEIDPEAVKERTPTSHARRVTAIKRYEED